MYTFFNEDNTSQISCTIPFINAVVGQYSRKFKEFLGLAGNRFGATHYVVVVLRLSNKINIHNAVIMP